MEARTRPLTDALRDTRGRKGWSQRDVTARMKLTQAQLSRIESGAADVRLSTFVELARLLDLEPVLVPRTALSGVNAIIRELEANQDARSVRGAANTLAQILRHYRQSYPKAPELDALEEKIRELQAIEPLFRTPVALTELLDITDELQNRVGETGSNWTGPVHKAVVRLTDLRNALVHQAPANERPAYTLDDED
ncbi:helix-turn-helix domain-containing protein [Caulobacter sp. UNC358MFTsu5.1]|uniref:helix-turn-helix domain-containing protein n=1 Tax=Caulobacter sp. UNC358MFTsu5.1 TaxID=1449049 RepID=UPI0009DDBD96|nr:helix-turn-helix transcriptional regulator [Caulobacter sp. UNC358MFTsu5.1]